MTSKFTKKTYIFIYEKNKYILSTSYFLECFCN